MLDWLTNINKRNMFNVGCNEQKLHSTKYTVDYANDYGGELT